MGVKRIFFHPSIYPLPSKKRDGMFERRLMAFNRDTIKKSFSKAASTYDEFALFQKDVALEVFERLFQMLSQRTHATAKVGSAGKSAGKSFFLDIGTGTGALAELVSKSVAGTKVCASDIAAGMLQKAREKHGEALNLAAADCCSLPFREGVFDSIGSSLALQWAGDLPLALREAARVLKPGGLFVFSTLAPSTLWELRECYKSYGKIEFQDRASIESAIKTSGLDAIFIEERIIKRRYDSFFELLKALKNIGAAPPMEHGKGLSPGKRLKEAGKLYAERFPSPQGGIEASYALIIAGLRKV